MGNEFAKMLFQSKAPHKEGLLGIEPKLTQRGGKKQTFKESRDEEQNQEISKSMRPCF